MFAGLKNIIYIKIISTITVISFLAYDIAWAYPERPRATTETLVQQTIFTLPDKDTSHVRVAARYLEEVMAKRLEKEPLAGVQDMLEFIRDVATTQLEVEGKKFRVQGGAEQGQVFVFLDDDCVLRYYNPRLPHLSLPSQGMREVGMYPVNKYLNFQLLRTAPVQEAPKAPSKKEKQKKPAKAFSPQPAKTEQDVNPVYVLGTKIASDIEYVRTSVLTDTLFISLFLPEWLQGFLHMSPSCRFNCLRRKFPVWV